MCVSSSHNLVQYELCDKWKQTFFIFNECSCLLRYFHNDCVSIVVSVLTNRNYADIIYFDKNIWFKALKSAAFLYYIYDSKLKILSIWTSEI